MSSGYLHSLLIINLQVYNLRKKVCTKNPVPYWFVCCRFHSPRTPFVHTISSHDYDRDITLPEESRPSSNHPATPAYMGSLTHHKTSGCASPMLLLLHSCINSHQHQRVHEEEEKKKRQQPAASASPLGQWVTHASWLRLSARWDDSRCYVNASSSSYYKLLRFLRRWHSNQLTVKDVQGMLGLIGCERVIDGEEFIWVLWWWNLRSWP